MGPLPSNCKVPLKKKKKGKPKRFFAGQHFCCIPFSRREWRNQRVAEKASRNGFGFGSFAQQTSFSQLFGRGMCVC